MRVQFVPLSDDIWGKDELVTVNFAELLMIVVGYANPVMIQQGPVQAVPPIAPECSYQWLNLAALSAPMLCGADTLLWVSMSLIGVFEADVKWLYFSLIRVRNAWNVWRQ